jgi:hypothetical protein
MHPLRLAIMRLLGDLARDQARRAVMAVSMWTVAFLLILTALGFAVGGVYSAIEAPLGSIAASFILAGMTLALALLLVFLAGRYLRQGRRSRHEAIDEFAEEHPRATGIGDVAAAFAYGLAKGLTKRRKS